MKITLKQVGKQFNHTWIFKDVDAEFNAPQIYGITGSNGSGKSTLLKMLAGYYTPTKGIVVYEKNDNPIEREQLFKHLSYSAPYISLHEELNITETLKFHSHFKTPINGMDVPDLLEISELKIHKNKALKDFSSGMQQRVKLCLSLLFDSSLLLLDEPCNHLDKTSYQWFFNTLEQFSNNRLIIIASNEEAELKICSQRFDIEKCRFESPVN